MEVTEGHGGHGRSWRSRKRSWAYCPVGRACARDPNNGSDDDSHDEERATHLQARRERARSVAVYLLARTRTAVPRTMSESIRERSRSLSALAVATAMAEKTSGAPLPMASSVQPATSGESRSRSER